MSIFRAIIYRTDTEVVLDIGQALKGKMHMLRAMQNSGDKVIRLFNDCGEFKFVWNKKIKVWEFFNQDSVLVGFAKFVRDRCAEQSKKLAYYDEVSSAYAAQQEARRK